MKKTLNIIIFLVISSFFGCSYVDIIKTEPAKLGSPSETNQVLKRLPKAQDKIVCAVYKFRDQTGQYKASANGSSWSTAVTQGATTILMKALEESGWFIPIEREGLSNLLNERKIIKSSRSNYITDSSQMLPDIPPLLYAGILLEGGIISYETNIFTGGAGIKYLGINASDQYRQDQVTVYLRAISTQNGRVLKTVYTSKTILSQAVDLGLFKYVEFKKLLEAETGYSYNEPPQLCVTAAIEKAVQSLVVEGALEGLWAFQNPNDVNSGYIQSYIREKNEIQNVDYVGRQLKKQPELILSLQGGGLLYNGDYPYPNYKGIIGGSLTYNFSDAWGVTGSLHRGNFSTEQRFSIDVTSLDIAAKYSLHSDRLINPFLFLGGSISYGAGHNLYMKRYFQTTDRWNASLLSGVGMDLNLHKNFGFSILLDNHYFVTDDFDGVKNGKFNDYFWSLKAGINVNVLSFF